MAKMLPIFEVPNEYKVFAEYYKDMKGIYLESDPDELIVFDFIAGMTDGYAVKLFLELFVPQATV